MARQSLRHLFAGLFTPTTPNRKARRANRWQTIEQLEDRTVPATFYVGELSDFAITNDVDMNGVPTNGDTVTWNQDGLQHDNVSMVPGLLFGTDAFTSIQQAVNVSAATGDIILVTAGIYSENVTVNKSVQIRGAKNATPPMSITPRGSTALPLGQRESVIQPTTNNSADGTVVAIRSDNVTFDGFRVTGSSFSLTGGTAVNGIPVYAARGIATGTDAGGYIAVNNFTLEDTVVLNNAKQGVLLSAATTGGSPGGATLSVARNVVDNVGGMPTADGTAIDIRGIDGSVTNNITSRSRIGIGTTFANISSNAAAASQLTITGNTVTTLGGNAVGINLTAAQGGTVVGGTGTLANTVSQSGVGAGIGILAQYGLNDAGVSVLANTITNYQVGALATINGTPQIPFSNLTISRGNATLVGSIGVAITAQTPFQTPDGVSNASLTGTTITGYETGILVQEGNNSTPPAAQIGANLQIGAGNTVVGGVNGLVISGANAKLVGNTLSTISFDGTQTGQFVRLANNAYQGAEITGSGANYGGLTDPFAIENKLFHRPDDATLGLIRVVAGTLFVTPGQSIQTAINNAPVGSTVSVGPGTYAEVLTIPKLITLQGQSNRSAIVRRPSTGAATSLVTVSTSDVTISGFTFNGDDGITDNGESSVIGGTVSDTDRGIFINNGTNTSTATLIATVQNNTIQNFKQFGVLYGQPTGGSGKTTGSVTGNSFDGVGVGVPGAGSGFAAYSLNGNPSFTGNIVTDARAGVWYQFPTGATTVTVTGNTITATEIGVAVNNPEITGAITVGGVGTALNTVTITGSALSVGLLLIGTDNAAGTAAMNNAFQYSGGNQAAAFGVLLFNNGGGAASSATITGGTINGFGSGAVVTNSVQAGSDIDGTATQPATLTLSGVAVTVPANALGVGAQAVAGGNLATAILNPGTSVTSAIGVTGTTGVSLGGPQARATFNGVSFDGTTTTATDDNTTDVLVGADTAAGAVTFNAGNSFAGENYYLNNQSPNAITLASATTAQTYDVSGNFRIEDHVFHKVDDTTKGLVTFVANNVYVTAPGTVTGTTASPTTDTDSSIQRGVDATAGETGFTVNVEAGSYAQAVNVNQSVTLHGSGAATTTVTAPVVLGTAVVTIAAPNVTVEGFTLVVTQASTIATFPGNNTGVFYGVLGSGSNWDNALVQNNTITTAGSVTGRESRGIRFFDDLTNQSVVIRANTVTGNGSSRLWRGIEVEQVKTATIGGTTSADGNTVENAAARDIRVVAAGSNGTTLVQYNTTNTAGLEVVEPLTGHAVTFTKNTVTTLPGYMGLFVNHNYTSVSTVVNVTENTFNVPGNSYGLLSAASRNVTVTGNMFKPVADATNFALVVVDTQMRDGDQTAPLVPSSIDLRGNTFDDADVAGGVGLAIFNGNSTMVTGAAGTPSGVAPFGTITLGGTAVADRNTFAAGLAKFIQLNATQNPAFTPVTGGMAGPVAVNIDATGNTFDVDTPTGSGQQLPSAMSPAGKFDLERKLFHKPDNTALGLITVVPNNVYVTAFNTIQRGIDAVPDNSTTFTVNVEAGTFTESVTVNESVTLRGANAGISVGKVAGTRSNAAGESVIASPAGDTVSLVTVTATGVVIDGFTIDGASTTGTTLLGNATSQTQYGVYVDNGTSPAAAAITVGVVNNRIQNFVRHGALFGQFGVVGGKTAGSVAGNAFDNIGTPNGGDGFALQAWNGTPSFTGNAVTDARVGAWYQQLTTATGDVVVTGNAISTTQVGVAVNQASPSVGAITVGGSGTGDGNTVTVTGVGFTTQPKIGLLLIGTRSSGPTVAAGNTFAYTGTSSASAMTLANEFGVLLFNAGGFPQASAATVRGGSIAGFGNGAVATNFVPGNGGISGAATGDAALTLDGVAITVPSFGAAAVASGTTNGTKLATVGFAATTGPTTLAPAAGATNTTGLALDGPLAKVANDALGAVSFASGLAKYIVLSNAAYGTGAAAARTINATAATFGGVAAGNELTAAPAFAIVDKITDRVDDGTLGFVQLQEDTAFVTPNSKIGAAAPDIQRAVDALGAAGGTVVIQGGMYTGDVNTSAGSFTLSPGGGGAAATVTIVGNLALDANDAIAQDILSEATYDKFVVTMTGTGDGTAQLGGANLAVTVDSSYTPLFGEQYTVVQTQGLRSGTFGNTQPFTTASGDKFFVVYDGMTAKLVAAGSVANPTAQTGTVYVDDGYAGMMNGAVIADADPTTANDQKAVFGVNAFASVNDGIDAVNSGGEVRVANGTYAEAVDVDRTVTVTLQGTGVSTTDAVVTINSLAGITTSTVAINGQKLIAGDTTDTTFNGVFVDSGDLVKQGSGTFTLSGMSSFSGVTAVNAGTLSLTGSLGGAVNVNTPPMTSTSGTLIGTGTIGGLLTNAGTVAPGTDGTTGRLTLNGGYTQTEDGTLQIDVNGTTQDLLAVTGAVLLDGLLDLTITNPAADTDAVRRSLFIDNNGATDAVDGTFSNYPANALISFPGDSRKYVVNYAGGDGNDVELVSFPATAGAVLTAVVDDDFAGLPTGAQVVDDNSVTRTVGFDAFATLQTAVDNLGIAANGKLQVSGGDYKAQGIDVSGLTSLAITLQADTKDAAGNPKTPVTTVQIGSIADAAGKVTIALGRQTLQIGGNDADFTLAGPITGTGTFVKVGAGTLTLAGANTYSGATKINEGTLIAGADEVIPDFSPVTLGTATTTATLDLTVRAETIGSLAGAGTVNLNNAVLSAGRLGTNTTFAGAIGGNGQFVKVGAGTLTFTGANTYTGGTLIEAGTLQLSGPDGDVGTGDVDTGSGFLTFNKPNLFNATGGTSSPDRYVFPRKITGNGGVVQNGTGKLALANAANDYTGGTVVNKGTLLIGTGSTIGSGDVTANAAGKIEITSAVAATDRVFNLNGGATLTVDSGATLTLTGNSQVNGGTLVGPGLVSAAGNAAFTGVTIAADVMLTVTGGTTSFANIVNNGKFVVASDVTGTMFSTLSSFTNVSSGRMSLSGTAKVANFASTGLVEVLSGGLLTNTGTTDLVFGGGSITRLGTDAASQNGGTIDLGDANMLVSSGIVSNNGLIRANFSPMFPAGRLLTLDNNSTLFLSNGDFADVLVNPVNGSVGDAQGFAS